MTGEFSAIVAEFPQVPQETFLFNFRIDVKEKAENVSAFIDCSWLENCDRAFPGKCNNIFVILQVSDFDWEEEKHEVTVDLSIRTF